MDSRTKFAKTSYEFARRTFDKLVEHPTHHLSNEDMKDLGIKCTGLDLETGKSTDGGDVFISPYPLTELDKILQENKPWRESKLDSDKDPMDMLAALEISSLLEYYLILGADEEAEGLIDKTKWRLRNPNFKHGEILCRRDRHADWQVPYLFDEFNPSTPHVSCFLGDNAPMKDDQLSVSEMWCVVAITATRLRRSDYRMHRLFPVTIISAASRKLRIVQAYLDNPHERIVVRKSKILDFETDNLATTELVLSWAIGNPIGDTKHKVL